MNYKNAPEFITFRIAVILIFFIPPFLTASEPDVIYTIRKEVIRIIDYDSGYISEVTYVGKNKQDIPIKIHYNCFDSIFDIQLFKDSGKYKFKKEKNLEIMISHELPDQFYMDIKSKFFILDEPSRFTFTYKKHCSELITMSILPFIEEFPIDTFFYQIYLPNEMNLIFDTQNISENMDLKIDSTKNGTDKIYTFVVSGQAQLNDFSCDLETPLRVLPKFPMVRLLVTPNKFRGRESQFFNRWYLNKIDQVNTLDAECIKVIDEITSGFDNNRDSIIHSIVNFAQKKIKYIDNYSGLGSIVPNDVNSVLTNLQGDCKDYSNFICQALKHKGIDAWLAICATSDYFADIDFPTLGGANHMVCAIKNEQVWSFIDGTEKYGITNLPPLSVQGKHIYILDTIGETIIYSKPLDASQNHCDFYFDINVNNGEYTGTFSYQIRGYHAFNLEFTEYSYKRTDFYDVAKQFINLGFKGFTIDTFSVKNRNHNYQLEGEFTMSKSFINKIQDKTYILLNYLPFPHSLQKNIDCLDIDILTERSINNTFTIVINFNDSIHSQNSPRQQDSLSGFEYQFSSDITENKLSIHYSFTYDDFIIPAKSISSYNLLNKSINEIFKKSIILE
ncbi:MAG: hypothetical protein R2750_02075 [Bacteroidales bacterium]